MLLAAISAEQWNWVGLAYGVTYVGLVAYAASIAVRITRARNKLGETE
ncbi:MAG: hypothetical protein ABFR95_03865 [Actinomycetota bacterium]